AVLARLVPLDLRPQAFPVGAVARTLLGHMHAGVLRTRPATLRLLAFRSMAGTLVQELRGAMEGVAARHGLDGAGSSR
ncbi:MAG: hypothetical protein ACLFPZ_02115, partial [Rhodosalinus sp.]